jgi:hypothetical protein
MAAVSPPAGGGINGVFPTWRKNNIRVCPVTSPADGGGGGATMAKQEASAVSPQHANPKQTNDGSTLAKDLLGVILVPETTVQSASDVTLSPPVDQEVPTDSHLVPFGFSSTHQATSLRWKPS